jgi:hypothetical protein
MATFDDVTGQWGGGDTVNGNLTTGLYGNTGTYTAPNNSGVNYGLNYSAQTGYTPNLYPGYVSPPSGVGDQVRMPDYQPYAIPSWSGSYQGMMGSDYDAWQKALTDPGATAAQTAYNQANVKLNNQMGGQGLYGSSIMSNQANAGLNTTYQNALATNAANAAATRYGMQQTDVNNQNTYNEAQNSFAGNMGQLGVTQAQNEYNALLNKANAQQTYNNLAAGSSDSYNQYLYNLAAMGYGNTQQLTQLGLLGSSNAATLAQNNFNATNATNSANGYLGAAGTVLGGLLTKSGGTASTLTQAGTPATSPLSDLYNWGVNAYQNA